MSWSVQIPSLFVSTHVTRGLCKILGYEALEHGTSFSNYISILKSGGDPGKGGETTSLAMNDEVGKKAQNYFYVFRDSKISLAGIVPPDFEPQNGREKIGFSLMKSICRRSFPLYHIYYSYIAEYMKKHPGEEVPRWVKVVDMVRALFTPRVRFIYNLEEIQGAFEEDKDYNMGLAYRTREHLPNDRISLMGLFKHAKGDHVVQHIKNHPCEVIKGIGQLAAGIFLTYSGLGLFF